MTLLLKKLIPGFTILIFTAALCAAVAGYRFYRFSNTPLTENGADQLFLISPGDSLSSIAANLENQHLIGKSGYFKLLARFKNADKKLQAGEYLLSASKSPNQILSTLLSGKVKLHKVTIPEGFNLAEIATVFETAGFCDKNRFLELCHDRSFAAKLGFKTVSLEGYLFPDTYFFPKNSSCQSIIRSMTTHFNRVFTDDWEKRAAQLKLSVHEVVTLASIIEKETGDPGERPLISSVFHNRLKKRMRLESDPTVIYGIKDFDGNIKRKHLRELTPYNTYQIRGLPVGPIASPGEKSIEAALYPVKSDYLFFVSKKDTTHYFSKTIDEHNRAVQKYQLRRR